eukprot:COSAG02_NODE_40365_length_406_cov_1.003257_1_plen_32_part_10
MVLELAGLTPAHAHDDRCRYGLGTHHILVCPG